MARRKRSDMEEGGKDAAADRPARERHLRVPPPLTEGREAFEGGEILDELDGELGGVLWNALRSATLWARANPARRAQMAAPQAAARRAEEVAAAGAPEPLVLPLAALTRVLSEPASVEPTAVAAACRSIAEWANAQGMLGTALAYLQAAALARPDDAGISYAVGRMARRRGEPTRAESWLQYAIVQARRKSDWETYTLVYAGLGNLYAERGNLPSGRRALTRALRSAQRHSLRRLEGETLHDLFTIAATAGNLRESEQLAAATLEVYGSSHPRLPFLAADLAFLWVGRGLFREALAVYRTLIPHMRAERDRALLLSGLARAAAGAGEPAEYRRTAEMVQRMLSGLGSSENVAASYVNLAYGAEQLGEMDDARELAQQAVGVAAQNREGKLRLMAEAVLDRASRGAVPQPAPARSPRQMERSGALAERLSEVLAAGAA
jgi:tetratricopeptide (TPR) repeat protein